MVSRVTHASPHRKDILPLEPAGDLLGRPVRFELRCHQVSQAILNCEQAPFRTPSTLRGTLRGPLLGLLSPIVSAPAVAIYLPAHRGDWPAQPSGDRTKGFSGSEPAGDLLPL